MVTVSGVRSPSSMGCGEGVRLRGPCFRLPSFSIGRRGRVFRKIWTIRRLMGNIRMELSNPIITSCQVNSILPKEKRREGDVKWRQMPRVPSSLSAEGSYSVKDQPRATPLTFTHEPLDVHPAPKKSLAYSRLWAKPDSPC